jgi:SSS family transporter
LLIFSISVYLALNLLIGWWASSKVKTTEDFVLAGRGLGFMMASMVTFATWFGSETLTGAPAEFVKGGFLNVIEEPFGAALCLILVGMFYARTFYRMNIITFCDFFRIRFGPKAELISAILIVPSYFGWIAAQLIAMGVVLEVITGLALPFGIAISALIVMVYTIMGGMWSVSITDFLHNIILIIGLFVLGGILLVEVGGLQPIVDASPKGFFSIIPHEFTFQSSTNYLAAWITVGLGSIPQQDVFQRVMSAKNENVAVRSSIMAGCMYLTIAIVPLFIALMAKFLHPELLAGDTKMMIPTMVLKHTNIWVQILFFGAMISAILSTTSGAMLAPAAIMGENIAKFFRPTMTDAQGLYAIRVCIVLITFCCIWMAIQRQDVYALVSESSAFSLVSLFIPLTAGLKWKRATTQGCLASMLMGWGVWMACYWANTQTPAILYGLVAGAVGMLGGSLLFGQTNQG